MQRVYTIVVYVKLWTVAHKIVQIIKNLIENLTQINFFIIFYLQSTNLRFLKVKNISVESEIDAFSDTQSRSIKNSENF